MAEDRLPCWRPLSISPTSSESVMLRRAEISFMPFQKASSRLTLVLCPATTIERFTTGDFIRHPRDQFDADPEAHLRDLTAVDRACALICFGRTVPDWRRPACPTARARRVS